MPCVFCKMGVCINPDHAVVQLWSPPEPREVLLFDIRRPFSARPMLPRAEPKPEPTLIYHGVPLRDYLRLRLLEPQERVSVQEYADGWEKDSNIVRDARALEKAWKRQAKAKRGHQWKSSEPPDNRCSGHDWVDIDEGMDVAAEIVQVDMQAGRTKADGTSLWKAGCFGFFGAVGILIMEHASSDGEGGVQLGIRWLIGHPTKKGAGSALMAKANELHRLPAYRAATLRVTSAASSVGWYASKGFVKVADAACNDEDTPCGCVVMEKAAPG